MPTVVIIGFIYNSNGDSESLTGPNNLRSTITDIYQVYSFYRGLNYRIYVASDIVTVDEPENTAELCAGKIIDINFKEFIHKQFLNIRNLVLTPHNLEKFFNEVEITHDRRLIIYYTGHGIRDHILLPDGSKYSALELRASVINLRIEGILDKQDSEDRVCLNTIGSTIFIIFDCCNPHGLYLPFQMNRNTYDYDIVSNSFTLPEVILITSSESDSLSQAQRNYSLFTKALFEIFRDKRLRYDFQYLITTLDKALNDQKVMVRVSTPKLKVPWSWVVSNTIDIMVNDCLDSIVIKRNSSIPTIKIHE